MIWNRKARLFYRLHVFVNRWARHVEPFDKSHPFWRLNNMLARVWLDERDRLNPPSEQRWK